MNRPQLEALLADGKATNQQGSDFVITVPHDEVGRALTILKHLEASGIISGFDRRDSPEEDHIDITGYTG